MLGLAGALLAPPEPRPGGLLGFVLGAAGALQLPLALLLGAAAARPGGKEGALAAAIAQGVVLATPAWFACFAWLSGLSGRPLLFLLGLLALHYALGFALAGRYAPLAQPAPSRLAPPARQTTLSSSKRS